MEIVIEPRKKAAYYWRELFQYRELFYFLAWRDILVRYKQTAIGIAWCLLRPLLTMVVFSLVFGRLAKLPSDSVPYPLLVFAAMLPWQLFAGALSDCSNSLIANANLLTKVYFPRLIVPASTLVVSLVDFLLSFIVLLALLSWYGVAPGWKLSLLPLFLLQAMMTAFGAGLLMAALNARYRDVGHLLPFIVQAGLFVSPVGFSSAVVPADWKLVYSLNPLVGVIDGFRWAILGEGSALYLPGYFISVALTLTLVSAGLWQFRQSERTLVDII